MLQTIRSPWIVGLMLLVHAGLLFANDEDKARERAKVERIKRLERLEQILTEAEDKVRRKRNELMNVVDTLGIGDSSTVNLTQQSALQQFGRLRSELSKIRMEKLSAEMELKFRNKSGIKTDDDQPSILSDAEPGNSKTELASPDEDATDTLLRESIENDVIAAKLLNNIEKYRSRLAEAEQQLAARKKQLAKSIHQSTETLAFKVEILKKQESHLIDEMKQLQAEARKLGQTSVDIEMKRKEIEALDPMVTKIMQEIERVRFDLQESDPKKEKP